MWGQGKHHQRSIPEASFPEVLAITRHQSKMSQIKVFRNCCLLRNHEIRKEDLWVCDGRIIDPEPLFFDGNKSFDVEIDCQGGLIAPGLIDLQINGGFGVDFTFNIKDEKTANVCLDKVGKGILAHGRLCQTPVSSTMNYTIS